MLLHKSLRAIKRVHRAKPIYRASALQPRGRVRCIRRVFGKKNRGKSELGTGEISFGIWRKHRVNTEASMS